MGCNKAMQAALNRQLVADFERAAATAEDPWELGTLIDVVLDELLGNEELGRVVRVDLYASRYRLLTGLRRLRDEAGDDKLMQLITRWTHEARSVWDSTRSKTTG